MTTLLIQQGRTARAMAKAKAEAAAPPTLVEGLKPKPRPKIPAPKISKAEVIAKVETVTKPTALKPISEKGLVSVAKRSKEIQKLVTSPELRETIVRKRKPLTEEQLDMRRASLCKARETKALKKQQALEQEA